MGNNFVSLLLNLFCNAEREIVGIYAFAYLFPILVAVIDRIPVSETNVASLISPFGYYAILLPLSIVFFGPSLIPFSLGPMTYGASLTPFSVVFLVSFVFYPVVSYFLLRRYGWAWILSFISSLATIALDAFVISNIPELAVIWLFGIATNMLILYLLYSCRTEFIY